MTADSGNTAFGTFTPFAVRKRPPTRHKVSANSAAAAFDAKPNLAVIEEQLGPRTYRIEDLGMGQRRTASVAGLLAEIEAKAVTGREFDPTLGEATEAQLWSLQIGQNPDRPARRALDRPDRLEAGSVILLRTVAEIQPEYIDAGFEQIANPLGRRTRRAECRDDFRAAEAPCLHLQSASARNANCAPTFGVI